MRKLTSANMVGVGLRSPHIDTILAERPTLGWLEIHSENYFNPDSVARAQLREIATHYPLSCHGIGLSLGSADPINIAHLQQLKQLIDDIQPFAISEHLSWSSVNGQYFNDLLPLPYTEQTLAHFSDKTMQAQDFLGQQLLIENPSSYLSFAHSTMPEWQFLQRLQQRTGCGLLLDLNNVYVSACNHGFDSLDYLAAIDPSSVQEIHLAGFTHKQFAEGELYIDTHSRTVSEPVWQLYRHWIKQHSQQHGLVPTLIEWDLDIPPLARLIQEAGKAKQIIQQEVNHGQCRV